MIRERVKKCLRHVIDAVEADLELLDLLDQAISRMARERNELAVKLHAC